MRLSYLYIRGIRPLVGPSVRNAFAIIAKHVSKMSFLVPLLHLYKWLCPSVHFSIHCVSFSVLLSIVVKGRAEIRTKMALGSDQKIW